MENPISGKNYEEIKRDAKEFHRTLGTIWCPMLNDYVACNDIGFRHLVRKGHRFRLVTDQIRRFLLLPLIKEILTDPNIKLIFDEKDIAITINKQGLKIKVRSKAKFWKIIKKYDDKTITLVIRQIASGKKHFFSIYDQKTARQ